MVRDGGPISGYFRKLERKTAGYVLYKRRANGVFLLFLGIIRGMGQAGYSRHVPSHEYFLPVVLAVAGVFELIRSLMLSPKD